MKEFKLPDIGEGIHEGEIVRWLVNEGDAVSEDQPIAEVMTDKATVEITSPYTGTVKSLNAAEGETVLVGATIIVIDDGASTGNGRAPEAAAAAPASPPPTAAPKASEPPAPPKPKEQAKEPAKPKAEEPAPAAPAAKPAPAPAARGVVAAPPAAASGPVLATPATRRLARELGVDLRALAGSGPRGRVTREDVQRANQDGGVAAPAAAATAPAEAGAAKPKAGAPAKRPPAVALPSGGEQRFPLRGLRKKIAEHMARSKRTAAHFTYVEEIDVTELVKLRREAKELAAEQDVKLTYLPFIMKAIVRGLKRFPMLNASLDEEKAELVHKYDYNFGIAVDTPDGLVVPVVKGVDHLSVLDLAREVERVATAARERTVALDDLRGGTFTITNAGNIGGLFATPVINHPEVAILGVHKISRRPVVRGDEIVIGDVMWLSISIDHRVVDGADGARFMNEVKRVLERPGLLLLEGV